MPPWPGRVLSPGARNEPGANANLNLPNSTSPARPRTRLTESDILENAYGIPTLPSHSQAQHGTTSASKSTRTPTGHGRSMSHPFPSLFAGKKKHNVEVAGGFESTDDDMVSPSAVRNAGNKQKVLDKELRVGKCMTCDSQVRWPKELRVFRCTVCLTINDLKPIVLEARRGDGQRVPVPIKAGTYPGSFFSARVLPLSIDKTRHIIDRCIITYLAERLNHDEEPSSDSPSPLPSPTWVPPIPTKDGSQANITHEPNFQSMSTILPSRPITRNVRSAEMGHTFQFLGSNDYSEPAPYSRSTPGQFFDPHMEQRSRDSHKERLNRTDIRSSGEREDGQAERRRISIGGNIFKPLEEYIITSFGSYECINTSFSTIRPNMAPRAASEGSRRMMPPPPMERPSRDDGSISEMDAKTLLIGNIAENGFWWTGETSDLRISERSRTYRGDVTKDSADSVTLKSPRVDWAELNEWYYLVCHAGRSWKQKLENVIKSGQQRDYYPSEKEIEDMEEQIRDAQLRSQRVLLKATESLLKRPARPLNEPGDLRFLLIILANPLLYPPHIVTGKSNRSKSRSRSRSRSRGGRHPLNAGGKKAAEHAARTSSPNSVDRNKGSTGQHSGIIKRILGLLSNLPNECHHHLVSWFARYSDTQFQRLTDLIGSFVTYRLTRQHGKKREIEHDPTAGLIPNLGSRGEGTSAALHDALGSTSRSRSSKKSSDKPHPAVYNEDWQIKAAARVMALVFSANNSGIARKVELPPLASLQMEHSAGLLARERAQRHGQILATSDFYNTLLDYSDLIADFEAWESKRGKFVFCQYPFFLSIWAKIQIMEHDARRQMEVKAREAFFDSIMTRKTINQYLVLKIRRECLVEDSLKSVSEVVGTGGEEIKKGLRIEFKGEEGIDAGGLRKEWFLLLVRDVFNPEHGMFTYDDDSQFCYFNPHSFETTDQFFLVGVVLGLAIYNSTILDVAFPPFAFRKLLAAAPVAASGATSHAKPSMIYSLDDLAEFRPALAHGLRQLLEFDGDVESTFCRDFVADVERHGEIIQVPLCANGEKRPVTNANKREFVDLYVRYLLDTSVVRQFEPFKRGFFSVCGGNALSLFRPEEIELLIRGSEEPLDIASLRAVSKCEGWGSPDAAENEPVVKWFWQAFQAASSKDQRKLLSFITGSDRIPAMGATNLVIKLSCLGGDSPRFPVARTCFNQLSLYRYSSKAKLEKMLWWAVHESEGFGLK